MLYLEKGQSKTIKKIVPQHNNGSNMPSTSAPIVDKVLKSQFGAEQGLTQSPQIWSQLK